MAAQSSILSPELQHALGEVAQKLETGKKLGIELETAIRLLGELPPRQVARADGAIAQAANLYHRRPRTVWAYLVGRRPTDAGQLLRTPDLKYLFLFHRDGRMREAALRMLSGGVPNPFIFSAILWRLNDWVKQVRDAAVGCSDRSFTQTDASIVAGAAAGLLLQQSSWRRWDEERAILDRSLARPDVAECLARLVWHGANGPLASVLRYALRAPTLDHHLTSLAFEAVQPSVRAVALGTLINCKAEWPTGSAWQWVDKPMGVRRRVTVFDDRPVFVAVPRSELIARGLRDKAAVVRRVALDGIIRHLLAEPEGRDFANALVNDRSPSVRERVAFILRPAAS